MQTPFDYCWSQVQRYERQRALALRLAPPELRDGLVALYAFNLELAKVAPLVSHPLLADIRFQWWRDALTEIASDQTPRNAPVVLALAQLCRTTPALVSALHALIDGWAQVTALDQAPDWQSLETALDQTHGRLAQAQICLAPGPNLPPDTRQAFAAAWGYGAVLQAYHASGSPQLFPRSVSPDPALFQDRGLAALERLRQAWPQLPQDQRGILASARLARLRLKAPEAADAQAALVLAWSQLTRRLP